MDIAPGVPGVNRFVARIVDYDTGRPVTARRVSLRFYKPDRPDSAPRRWSSSGGRTTRLKGAGPTYRSTGRGT